MEPQLQMLVNCLFANNNGAQIDTTGKKKNVKENTKGELASD